MLPGIFLTFFGSLWKLKLIPFDWASASAKAFEWLPNEQEIMVQCQVRKTNFHAKMFPNFFLKHPLQKKT